MSQFNSLQFLNALKADLQMVTNAISNLTPDEKILNTAPAPGKWSIAQVLEHLNFYHNFYLPEIEKAFSKHKRVHNNDNLKFTSGRIGGYLTEIMQPDAAGKVSNKTKAFKDYIPAPHLDAENVLSSFLQNQIKLAAIIEQAQHYDLNTLRVPMSITRLIRLKLGDLLRVLVVHQQRHLVQINDAIEMLAPQHFHM
ncbi:DinB family protein [uncultured Mucilaginibacter sp.]|uniref:DinB family protein n=1 Tax=uncultured Mucilaginibacter sp. TaxID=797541 RepID=UPI0025D0784B|nr:DinB family protein [uncultured Mucilaginibacter sp.]